MSYADDIEVKAYPASAPKAIRELRKRLDPLQRQIDGLKAQQKAERAAFTQRTGITMRAFKAAMTIADIEDEELQLQHIQSLVDCYNAVRGTDQLTLNLPEPEEGAEADAVAEAKEIDKPKRRKALAQPEGVQGTA